MSQLFPEKPAESPVEASTEIVLARSFGGLFENRAGRVSLGPDSVSITFSDLTGSFGDLLAARRSPANATTPLSEIQSSLYSPSGRELSNFGVSVSLTIDIGGEKFAVCSYRQSSDRLMLISGYVDAHTDGGPAATDRRVELLSAGLRELREEFLPARINASDLEIDMGLVIARRAAGLFSELNLSGSAPVSDPSGVVGYNLGEPYAPGGVEPAGMTLRYKGDSPWQARAVSAPSYLCGLHPAQQIEVDGQPLDARFHYDRQNNSGQIVFSYELDLAPAGKSLFHAETAADPARPGWLKEVLDMRGIVLLKLDPAGVPSGESFWLLDGALVPRAVEPAAINLSEVFAPATSLNGRSSGIVERTSIPFADFRAALGD